MMISTFGVFCLTAPNMAARVRRVVIAMPVLPGIDSGGRNKDNHETITNKPKSYYQIGHRILKVFIAKKIIKT